MVSLKVSLCVIAVCLVQSAVSRSAYNPPAHEEKAKMARYVVNQADWTAIGTISTQKGITGYPFVGLKSTADGGSGMPYMMMTPLDVSMIDLKADNKMTLFFSLAMGGYCRSQNYDPQDPRCARIMLTGNVEKVDENSEEFTSAKAALISKHPSMADWPSNHGFFVAKMNVVQIGVLDYFGGIEYVTPADYFKADLNDYQRSLDNTVDSQSFEVKMIKF